MWFFMYAFLYLLFIGSFASDAPMMMISFDVQTEIKKIEREVVTP